MVRKFRFCKSLIFCILACYSSFASDGSSARFGDSKLQEWHAAGLLDNAGRATRLLEFFQQKRQEHGDSVLNSFIRGMGDLKAASQTYLTPEIHGADLPSYGCSFSYDGRIDDQFCNYLDEHKSEEITVLVPAFGVGRSVLDALHINRKANVIANDLQIGQQAVLERLIQKYGLDEDRVMFLMGDILAVVKTLEAQSVDVVYVANLIHFLSPLQIQELLIELHRVLKLNGLLFLGWRGFSENISVQKTSMMYQLEKNSKIMSSWNLLFPRYIEKDDFEPVANLEYPYFAATVSDIKKLHDGIFECLESGEQDAKCKTYGFNQIPKAPLLIIGAYKVRAVTESSTPNFNVIMNYVILQKRSEVLEMARLLEEDHITMVKERREAIQKIPTCGHVHCKNLLQKPLMQCGNCKQVSYCGRDCQRADWAKHRTSCKKTSCKN